MRPTNRPFIVAGIESELMVRCVNCSTLTDSRYLLKGGKPICQDCIRLYNLVEISDRHRQVLALIDEGAANCEIHQKLNLKRWELDKIIRDLKRDNLIEGKGVRRTIWSDPRNGQKHLVTRYEALILDAALSPELLYEFDYHAKIAQRLNRKVRTITGIIHQLRKRGFDIPTRYERMNLWMDTMKQAVLVEKRPPKAIARQGGRNPRTPTKTLNRFGIHIRGENLACRIYRFLLQGSCSSKDLYAHFHREGFSRKGIDNALSELRRREVIAKSEGGNPTFSIIKEVDPCQIKRPRYRKKIQPMPPSVEPVKPLSSVLSTMPLEEERA